VLPKVLAEMVARYFRSEEELLALASTPVTKILVVDKYCVQTSREEELCFVEDSDTSDALKWVFSSSTINPGIKTKIIRSLIGAHTVYVNRMDCLASVSVNSVNQNKYKVFVGLLNEMREESMIINLNSVDLSHLNLSGINLSHVMAVGANFNHSILSKTALRFANLSGTDFSGALIEGADVEGAVFRNSNLAKASFSGSNMRFVDLTGARFEFTFISKSKSESTDFTGIITSDRGLVRFLAQFKNFFSKEIHVSGKVHLTSGIKEENASTCIVA